MKQTKTETTQTQQVAKKENITKKKKKPEDKKGNASSQGMKQYNQDNTEKRIKIKG